jgi:hypothetical protein
MMQNCWQSKVLLQLVVPAVTVDGENIPTTAGATVVSCPVQPKPAA